MLPKLSVFCNTLLACGLVVTSMAQGADPAKPNEPNKTKPAAQSSAIQSESNSAAACHNDFSPIYLMANEMSIATGQPSLVTMAKGATHIPVWSLSGGTVGQSVVGMITGLPQKSEGVKVEIVVTTNDKETNSKLEDVFRVHLSQIAETGPINPGYVLGDAVRTALSPEPFCARTIVLESYYSINPNAPLSIRIQREPDDPADTFTRPVGLVMVKVTPLKAPPKLIVVQDVKGYNSWPVIQAIGEKLVCVYSRGSAHNIGEGIRGVYARTSSDQGKTWTPETLVADSPDFGEVTIGKGLDSKGAMLLWVRRVGKEWGHDLYRTTDGITFTHVVTPKLKVMPIQITDVLSVPTVGLVSLWFAGNYGDEGPCHSWGTLVSKDDGATWTQNVIEDKLPKKDWPTEPSAVYLGDGKLLVVARTEVGNTTTDRTQLQMISLDYGVTWTRARTNITDVLASTPSLILDPQTGLLNNYYYHRGRGVLRRRVVKPEDIFNSPLNWPASEAVGLGSNVSFDAGNVNATVIKNKHYLAYYSGKGANTSVVITIADAATNKENPPQK